MIIEKYSQKFNLDFCILRFGSLYGENFNHFNSIGNLVLQAIKKENNKKLRWRRNKKLYSCKRCSKNLL